MTKHIYLDYASTTPVDPTVAKAMQPFFSMQFGNPSSLGFFGEQGKQAIEQSRKQIASVLNCRSSELIFTSGGTESNNLGIFGYVRTLLRTSKKIHIITSLTEHDSVLNCFKQLEKEGVEVTYLPCNTDGNIDIKLFKKSLKPHTRFVSLMYANNEVGTIHPIWEFAKIISRVNLERRKQKTPEIVFHTDACQATQFLSLNVQKLGVDMLTLNASKIYGPKGVGVLFARSHIELTPLLYGGGQERGVRSGTENVAGIVGLAAALTLAEKMKTKEGTRQEKLSEYLAREIQKQIPDVTLNGPEFHTSKINDRIFNKHRLPNNTNFLIKNCEGEALSIYLDQNGFSVSTSSACNSDSDEPSHVLRALGLSDSESRSSIRVTIGRHTTKQDITRFVKSLKKLVPIVRCMKTRI